MITMYKDNNIILYIKNISQSVNRVISLKDSILFKDKFVIYLELCCLFVLLYFHQCHKLYKIKGMLELGVNI